MKVSIIVPSHNKKENLLKTLTCLQRQKIGLFDVEIIVVDHASDDGTEKAISDTFFNTFPYVIYHRILQRTGWNASIPRNAGAKIADGELLYFVDSDVLLPPDRLQRLVDDFLSETDPQRVIIGPYHFLQESITVDDPEWYLHERKHYAQDVRWKSFQEHPVTQKNTGISFALSCFGGNLAIPRELFFQAGKFDESLGAGVEDGAMGLQLLKAGAVFSLDTGLLGWHNYHPILPERTEGLKYYVDELNLKHFGKINPDYGILEATKETYKTWNFDWHDPKWEGNT